MIRISGTVYLSNGLEIKLEDNMHKGNYADGTKYIVSGRKIIFITERISVFNEPDDEAMLHLYDAGWFDLWFLKNFNGKNYSFAPPELHARLVQKKKQEEFKQKVAILETKYPDLTRETKDSVYHLDHYHEYSDDGNVYRNAQARHEKVFKELQALGMEDFYRDYRKLLLSN